jgi:hypothetical protein
MHALIRRNTCGINQSSSIMSLLCRPCNSRSPPRVGKADHARAGMSPRLPQQSLFPSPLSTSPLPLAPCQTNSTTLYPIPARPAGSARSHGPQSTNPPRMHSTSYGHTCSRENGGPIVSLASPVHPVPCYGSSHGPARAPPHRCPHSE